MRILFKNESELAIHSFGERSQYTEKCQQWKKGIGFYRRKILKEGNEIKGVNKGVDLKEIRSSQPLWLEIGSDYGYKQSSLGELKVECTSYINTSL